MYNAAARDLVFVAKLYGDTVYQTVEGGCAYHTYSMELVALKEHVACREGTNKGFNRK